MIEQVKQYYDNGATYELERLNNPYSNIEFETTLHLISKYFPSKGKLLDIGAGPGRYSLELLKKGYKVSLLDLSEKELDIAKERIEAVGLEADGYYCKSATELDEFEDNSYDGVLVMGPLYHLHELEDRQHIIQETKRILKPEGMVLFAYINTWGALVASPLEFPDTFMDMKKFDDYIQGNLKFTAEEGFTACYFTSPPQAKEEVSVPGLELITTAGAESFLAGQSTHVKMLFEDNREIYNNYIKAACNFCELPQYCDTTEHFHIIMKKSN